ncbi:hypothetical protein [Dactylosporangium salmoneum]|uniref:Uncharacterized protein n=1 Tax=Dactylosporangium salmoneum TaxID=53361 RepID=A0ABP5T852_9ACTN
MTDYDRDPEAIAWARAKVQREVDKLRGWERTAAERGNAEQSMQWRKMANLLQMRFLGTGNCVIAAFDERLPEYKAIRDRAVKA